MGLFQSISDWFTGYDRENQARADAAAAELERMAYDDYSPGGAKHTAENWDSVSRNYGFDGGPGLDSYLPEAQAREAVGDAFEEGLKEGAENVSNFVKGAVDNVVGRPLLAILKGIPFWVWLGAGLYLAWKLGAFNKLLARR